MSVSIILAGDPVTNTRAGSGVITTEEAPTIVPSPILTPVIIKAINIFSAYGFNKLTSNTAFRNGCA